MRRSNVQMRRSKRGSNRGSLEGVARAKSGHGCEGRRQSLRGGDVADKSWAIQCVFTQQNSVMQRDGKIFVVVAADAPARSIVLPPCIPRACKVWDDAEHPSAARLKVQVMSGADNV